MSRRLASTSLRLLHRGNTHLADGRWSVLTQQRAQDQPQCRQTERAESGYIFATRFTNIWLRELNGAFPICSRKGRMTSCEITALQPSRYELLTDIVAANMPATTIPLMPGPSIEASIAGMASIGASVWPFTTG